MSTKLSGAQCPDLIGKNSVWNLEGTVAYANLSSFWACQMQNIALHAVPAYRAYALPAHPISFSLNVFNPQQWNVYWMNSESEFWLV